MYPQEREATRTHAQLGQSNIPERRKREAEQEQEQQQQQQHMFTARPVPATDRSYVGCFVIEVFSRPALPLANVDGAGWVILAVCIKRGDCCAAWLVALCL